MTELLSGDFYVPFGRSTSHQLWSSAMVITPILRGLFGISVDAQTKTITVNPHLPAGWDHAEVKNLRVGDEAVDLKFSQTNNALLIWLRGSTKSAVHLQGAGSTRATSLPDQGISIARHPVEVGTLYRKPIPGDRTQSPRVVNEEYGERKLSLTVEGLAGEQAQLPIFVTAPKVTVRAEGAKLGELPARNNSEATAPSQVATVEFPTGEGWKTITVTLAW